MTDGEIRVLEPGRQRRAPAGEDPADVAPPEADRAHRGRPRGAPVRRRAAAVPARDRRPRRHRPGDGRRPARRPRGLAPRSRHPAAVRRPRRARHRAGGRRARRALRRRGRGPAVAGVPRDARDRRLPPAGDEGRDRAHPWRRLRLHGPDAAPPPADRRARPVGRARPAVPVRHRLRLPGAVRADEPRGAAAARRRRRRPAGRGGRRGAHRASRPTRRRARRAGATRASRRRRPDARRAAPEGARRGRRRVAPRRARTSSPRAA